MFIETPASNHSIKCRRPLLGGAINDAKYNVYYIDDFGRRYACPIYTHWCNLLSRIFSDNYSKGVVCYKDVSICDEWLTFSNFYKWAKDKNYIGRDLDKDLKVTGNKVYSPSTCLFVPPNINKLIQEKRRPKHDLPTGVTIKSDGKFISRCTDNGKRVYLGVYFDKNDASKAYRNYKRNLIIEKAQDFIGEPDLYNALIGASKRYT